MFTCKTFGKILNLAGYKESEEYVPLHLIDPTKITTFIKWDEEQLIDDEYRKKKHSVIVLLSDDPTICHKYRSFNKFTKLTYPIPSLTDGWVNECSAYSEKKFKKHMDYVKNRIFDPTVKMYSGQNITYPFNLQDFILYKTQDNGGIGFLVFVKTDNTMVYVYGRDDVVFENYDVEPELDTLFVKQVAVYNPVEIFIGKSLLNRMTQFSGGHGSKWDGNSILLRIDGFHYVHIGIEIFEFFTTEPVTAYVSSVGNNCVPYPYAESLNYCYCMSNQTIKAISNHPDRHTEGDVFDSDAMAKLDMIKISGRDTDKTRYGARAEQTVTHCRQI